MSFWWRQKTLSSLSDRFRPWHVEAILGPSGSWVWTGSFLQRGARERDLVVAMLAERLIHPFASRKRWRRAASRQTLRKRDG